MPASDRAPHASWDIDAGIGHVAGQIEKIAARIEGLFAGERDDDNARAEEPDATGSDSDETSSNPLKHWRWE